ncbi:BrnA antitoxin family protein [Candidatus Thiosymbion oneisti]|uniref:BrnA antitoxin family protein n=1 Tax=Candidatus Thiosymbion oneisti TaxID=589554 RepID=UPI000B26EE74|nr:BrnA antitoxin family protein [Candidatus Thiosymbion oneisti]
MPRLKPNTLIPTPEEDAAITEAAGSDLDARPFTDEEWEQVKPTLRPGRLKAEVTKEWIRIRLSAEVVDYFRSTGSGWQTKMDAVLKEWMRNHA